MDQLITTIVARPYVFAFLAAYLVLAVRRWGWPRTLVWLVSGYLIAWASEISSIHNGFPYGMYQYVYENMSGELMIAGVPFFDSLSYVFLTFAGFTTANYLCARCKRIQSAPPPPKVAMLVVLGAFLTMMLDVIVDPVATMGEKWFLGKIHYYAYPGWYFGVPLSNFAGWFVVALAVIGFNAAAWHAFPRFLGDRRTRVAWPWLDPLFYLSIASFQIVMAFWIGEALLGIVSTLIIAALVAALLFRSRQSMRES